MKSLILAIAMNFVFYSQAMKYNPINLNQSPPGLTFNKSPSNLQFNNQKPMTQLERILKMLYSDPKNPGSYDPKNLDESVKSKKLIGVGMTAKVYKVKYDLENIEVVIKENELKSCEVFQREIKINEILKNKPGILKFYESLITEDPFKTHPKDFKYCFLIFELGQATLSDKIMGKDSFKNEREVVIKAQEIAIGLKSIHDAGYIHKDMKVENIIIVNGVAKISDFGVSIPDGATKSYGGNQLTMDIETVKLEREKYLEKNEDIPKVYQKTTDIFGFGIILFQMLTWTVPPFMKETHQFYECYESHTCEYTIPKGTNSMLAELIILTLIPDRSQRLTADSLLKKIDSMLKHKGPFLALKSDLTVHYHEKFERIPQAMLIATNGFQALQEPVFQNQHDPFLGAKMINSYEEVEDNNLVGLGTNAVQNNALKFESEEQNGNSNTHKGKVIQKDDKKVLFEAPLGKQTGADRLILKQMPIQNDLGGKEQVLSFSKDIKRRVRPNQNQLKLLI